MIARTCRPIGERTFCNVDIAEHTLRDGVWVCPVLSPRGYWVEPTDQLKETT